jgi:hypothetical protein
MKLKVFYASFYFQFLEKFLFAVSESALEVEGGNIIKFPPQMGISGQVFKNKSIFISNKGKHEPGFDPDIDNVCTAPNIKNFVFLYIYGSNAKPMGIIQFYNKKEGKITESDRV